MAKISVSLNAKQVAALKYIMARESRKAGESISLSDALALCVCDSEGEGGYFGRVMALDSHKSKADKVKAARKEGKTARGVTFKRYVPIDPSAKYDAAGTVREVATWTHKAPAKKAEVAA